MDKSNSLAKARAKSTAFAATVFLLPALLLIVIFMIYPVIEYLRVKLHINGTVFLRIKYL